MKAPGLSSTGKDRPVLVPTRFDGHGLSLAADVAGPLAAPRVLLLPGAGQTRHAWRSTARALAAQGLRAVSLDLRGHGDSEWAPDGDYLIHAFVNDLLAVLAQVGGPAIIVGASLGGIAGVMAAADPRGASIVGLVLVDVVPNMQTDGLQRIRAFMSAHSNGFASLEDAEAAVAEYLPQRRGRRGSGLRHNLRSGADGRLRWHWDPAFHAASAAREADGMLQRMAEAALRVALPTLLVTGERSDVVGREGIRQLQHQMPQAVWLDIHSAAHMVAGDDNDAFGTGLSRFLQSVLQV